MALDNNMEVFKGATEIGKQYFEVYCNKLNI